MFLNGKERTEMPEPEVVSRVARRGRMVERRGQTIEATEVPKVPRIKQGAIVHCKTVKQSNSSAVAEARGNGSSKAGSGSRVAGRGRMVERRGQTIEATEVPPASGPGLDGPEAPAQRARLGGPIRASK